MNGWCHLAVAFCFTLGAFLIDFDHLTTCDNLKDLTAGFNGVKHTCSRGIFHNPMILYCLVALTLGVALHFWMDKII